MRKTKDSKSGFPEALLRQAKARPQVEGLPVVPQLANQGIRELLGRISTG
jgi:hypothetical protein